MSIQQFTDNDRKDLDAFKKSVSSAEAKTVEWCKAIVEVDKRELWRLDRVANMHEWCLSYSPLAFSTMLSVVKKLRRLENERLIAETTGEKIIRTSHHAKPTEEGRASLLEVPPINNAPLSPPPPPKKTDKVYDQEGHEVPKHLVAAYCTRTQFIELAKSLKSIRERLVELRKGERIWKKVTAVAESHIGQAIADITHAVPHTVCTECQGWYEQTKQGHCPCCDSTGLMNDDQFDKVDKKIQQLHRTNHEATNVSRLSNSLP